MNIGIIGTGKIVNEMIPVVQEISGITIQAICSRPQSLSKAERLAALFHIKEVYNDYDAMLHKSDIDFVYVAVANHAHATYARRALLAKKNVIIEKPICTSVAELEELMQLAFADNLYIFEAVTLLHMPHYRLIKDELLAQLGRIKLIACNYSQRSSRYDLYLNHQLTPAFDPACHGGALMDINVYNINFVVSLFGEPIRAEYHPNVGHNKIDTSGVAILTYPDFVATCIAYKRMRDEVNILIDGKENVVLVFLGKCR
jgi:scyllo-inositol 2-dehydrogenase (NADP+)